MGLEHDFLPMRAMLIAQREQLFFEKQANNCIFFSAISPDSDRYSPLPPDQKHRRSLLKKVRELRQMHTVFCKGGTPNISILKWTIRWHCFKTLPERIFPDIFYALQKPIELPLNLSE